MPSYPVERANFPGNKKTETILPSFGKETVPARMTLKNFDDLFRTAPGEKFTAFDYLPRRSERRPGQRLLAHDEQGNRAEEEWLRSDAECKLGLNSRPLLLSAADQRASAPAGLRL